MNRVRVVCFAKINLTLEIVGRRDDGYHELRTVFQSVSLADELVLERGLQARHPTITMIGSPAPVGMDLCDRAARAFCEATGWSHDLTIRMHKHIPVGAGLGGGSADAAGTLAGLAALQGHCELGQLHGLAAGIGSDVPFFLQGGTALGSGRGERLEGLPALTEGWLVLAKPAVSVSTRQAYGLLEPPDYSDGSRTTRLVAALGRGLSLRELAGDLYNSFAPSVEERWPETRAVREHLLLLGARSALLSGSGSAVFGVFDDEASAQGAAEGLGGEGIWSVVARPVGCGLQVRAE